jgi:hypothetical protein
VVDITQAGRGLCQLGGLARGDLEELARLFHQLLTKERPTYLQNEIDVVAVAQLEDEPEGTKGLLSLPEFEKRLAQTGERVLVLGVEHECLLEALTSPRVLLTCESRVTNPNVQLHRIRIEREPLAKYLERLVILPFVVELMRAFVVLFGTQEWGRHGDGYLRHMMYAYSTISELRSSTA